MYLKDITLLNVASIDLGSLGVSWGRPLVFQFTSECSYGKRLLCRGSRG